MKKLLFDCGANNGCSVRKFATVTLEDFEEYEVYCFEQGAVGVKPPAKMPWGQYTAFFADPEGNIHELFTDLLEQD